MIYLFENQDNNASIVYDETTLTEEQKAKGVAIEQLPKKEEIEGKIALLKVDSLTGEVWYEYKDIPKTEGELQQEVINILGQELTTLKIQLIQGGVI